MGVEWRAPRPNESTSAAKAKGEERIRAKHPKIGGLIVALSDDPQSTTAWASGARGEAALGARLDQQASESLAVLHDRRIPGTKANIDHIVVATGGVFVVDAKRYVGKAAGFAS